MPSRELAIVAMRVPGIDEALARQLVAFVHQVRAIDLRKAPSISETIDWARALIVLGARSLDPALVQDTLGLLMKHQQDRAKVEQNARELIRKPRSASLAQLGDVLAEEPLQPGQHRVARSHLERVAEREHRFGAVGELDHQLTGHVAGRALQELLQPRS